MTRLAPVKLIKDQHNTLIVTLSTPSFFENTDGRIFLGAQLTSGSSGSIEVEYSNVDPDLPSEGPVGVDYAPVIAAQPNIKISADGLKWELHLFAGVVNRLIEKMPVGNHPSLDIHISLVFSSGIPLTDSNVATCASGIAGCPDPAVVEAEKAKAAAEKAVAEKEAAAKTAATSTLTATRDSALHLSRNGIAALQQRLGQLRHQNPDHNRLRIDFADPRLQALARALPLQSDLTPAAMGPWQPWVAGQITVGEQDNTDLDITLNALHTGIDRSHDRYHYGFALGLQNQQSKGSGLQLKTQQTAIASYGAVQFGRWPQSLEGIIGMGNLSSDIDRATTQAERAGKQTHASITYRLSFQHDQIQLSPYGRYDWSRITLDAYEESGSDALGYAVETINASFLAMGLGADFNRDQALQPFVQLEYAADLTSYGDSKIYYLSNPDTRYPLAGRSDNPSQWSLDLGLRYHLPRLRLDFRYGRHQSSDTTLNSLALSANWRF